MDILLNESLRAVTSQIDRIISAVYNLTMAIFGSIGSSGIGYMNQLVRTILNNDFLLIGTSLLVVGFVIGLLNRIIRI